MEKGQQEWAAIVVPICIVFFKKIQECYYCYSLGTKTYEKVIKESE